MWDNYFIFQNVCYAEFTIILSNEKFIQQNRPSEIFHFSNNGESSWYEFASEIIRILGINCQLNPIDTEDYPLAAKRPKYSVLSKNKISEEFDLSINNWKDSLKHCLNNIGFPNKTL